LNRLHLEMALFAGLECCIEQLPEPCTVIIHIGRTENTPTVEFSVENGSTDGLPPPTEASEWERLVECLDLLGATAKTGGGSSRFRFDLRP
jgi:hypothetical protein